MIHDVKQIDSLIGFIKSRISGPHAYYELLNMWIREEGVEIHDADTIDYYIALIPLVENMFKEAIDDEV